MEYNILGNTGLKVSKICFGSLTLSPLQLNMSIDEGYKLIKYGYDRGINFIDTAELYNNYEHINKLLSKINRKDYIVATKSYSYSEETAEKSLSKALKELNTDYIDIFLLHEQESKNTIKGHYEAIEYFLKAKEKGLIRAFGISTHRVEGVLDSCKYNEIEIIHPILNKSGIGIQDGNVDDMLNAIKKAYNMGKGIYSMKPIGGGHLIKDAEEALRFVNDLPFIHSIAIGMQSIEEIDANIGFIENGSIPKAIKNKLSNKTRTLHIADWCIGCGKCEEICKSKGISIVNNKAKPNYDNCVLCGYCANYCPEFCIKVI